MVDLVLASASLRRQQLLAQLGLSFKVVPSELPEEISCFSGGVENVVQELALAKARSVASRFNHALVIGADTVVVHGGRVLGKPGSAAEAKETLRLLSGSDHQVFTGLALVQAGSGRYLVGWENTRVFFRPLAEKEIEAYVKTGEPMDKAGSYGIQGLGAVLVERIEGCYFNVVGLPLLRLCLMLRRLGIEVLDAPAGEH